MIGTVRRERLDRILFWSTADLETKLLNLQLTTMAIERVRGWKDACQSRLLRDP
jgi:hypothetical protein